jgi:hypothetical protein
VDELLQFRHGARHHRPGHCREPGPVRQSTATDKEERMAIAVVQEWAAEDRSTEYYDQIDAKLQADGNPPGLILHCAGFDGEHFRIIDVWESDAAYEKFNDERLMPLVMEIVPADQPPPNISRYELHNVLAP